MYFFIYTIVLFFIFFFIKLFFSIYINKQYTSQGIMYQLSDSIYYGISLFCTPNSPYMHGFQNIKISLTAKSVWSIIYIIATSVAVHFEIPSFISAIPLTLQILGIFVENKQRKTRLLLFLNDKNSSEDISSEEYSVFFKVYNTLFYYQILVTILTIPLVLCCLYFGYKFNFIR